VFVVLSLHVSMVTQKSRGMNFQEVLRNRLAPGGMVMCSVVSVCV